MTDDKGSPKHSGVSKRSLMGAALMAAAIGFAAVYVTLGQPDNGGAGAPMTAGMIAPESRSVGAARAFAGFVRRNPPADLPEVAFLDESGAARTLADFKGKAVLLNLWATWCGPCRHEMPSLDRLQKELGSDTFEVVALSLDRGGKDTARKFFDEIKVQNLKLYIDSTMKAGNALRAVGMPTTILIGKDGRELGRLPGPAEWDSAEAKALIAEALK